MSTATNRPDAVGSPRGAISVVDWLVASDSNRAVSVALSNSNYDTR